MLVAFALLALCQRRDVHALRPQKTSSRRKGHTLEDVLIANVTPADVAHNDAMRFVREGVAYMESLGVKLSEQCEKRYGYTFITDQKYHHFRLCKSEARLNDDGTLSGVQRGASPLAKYRIRFAKKMQARKERLAAAAAAAAAANSSSTGGTARRRRRGLLQAGTGDVGRHAAAGAVGSSSTGTGALLYGHAHSRSELLPVGRRRHGRHAGAASGAEERRALLQAAAGSSSGGSSNSLMYKLLKQVTDKAANNDGGRDEDGASDVYNDDEEEEEAEAEADAAASEDGDEDEGGGGGGGGGGGYGKKKAEVGSAPTSIGAHA